MAQPIGDKSGDEKNYQVRRFLALSSLLCGNLIQGKRLKERNESQNIVDRITIRKSNEEKISEMDAII